METESDIQQKIQIEAMHYDCHLMRNNTGALNDITGRPVRYGLGNVSKQHNDRIKSSDLIGFTIVKGVAVFTAIEVKKPGWEYNPNDKREVAQLAFIMWVKNKRGIAGFCSSVEQFRGLMELHV